MREGQPSRTALGAALMRALHQDLDRPLVFADPLAWAVLGVDRSAALEAAAPRSRLRLFVAHRHAYAEQTLAAAYARGVRQCVVLGAGLDTIAHRNAHPDLRVLEVDHPDTQAWKRDRVAAAGLTGAVTYVPVDFEHDALLDRLAEAGFDAAAPAVFVWLGVVPYLTRDAVRATLTAVATVPGAEVVLDHAGTDRDDASGSRLDRLAADVAELGESFTAPWEAGEMAALLAATGFDEVEELPLPAGGGGHVVRARRTGLRG